MAIEQSKRTAQEIVDAVFRQYGDESGAQVTETDVIRWINEAQRDIVVNNREVNQTLAEFSSIENQALYNLVTLLPDVLRVHSVMYNNRLLPAYKFEDAQDKMAELTADATGEPILWYRYAAQMNVWPAPKETIENAFRIYYNKAPSILTAVTEFLGVPDQYYEAVNAFCMTKAYELDENAQMMNIKKEDYNRNLVLNSMDNSESNRDYPTIREVDY